MRIDASDSKWCKVADSIRRHQHPAVLVSGGVDSSLLFALAVEAHDKPALGITIDMPGFRCSSYTEDSGRIELGEISGSSKHELLLVDPFASTVLMSNPPERCYYCARLWIERLEKYARQASLSRFLVGFQIDELAVDGPGFRAFYERQDLFAWPFLEAGITKSMIRHKAAEMGLVSTTRWGNACLASRIKPGLPITPERLELVAECEHRVETVIDHSCARVRLLGPTVVSIEVTYLTDWPAAHAVQAIADRLGEIGITQTYFDALCYHRGASEGCQDNNLRIMQRAIGGVPPRSDGEESNCLVSLLS